MIGTTVGKYNIQDRIGRGGMGTVYLAVDATLRREVAIKVLNSELNDPEVARRFRSEAITVARLSHPGIATVYELFEHDGQWLMVMEFVRGETMEHLVERGGSLSVERAADLCVQALTALAHAHSMGVVHRDLKPANLMVTESGLVKVMDFGIARVAGSEHLTTAGFMMGTPAYMAPEQVLGHEIDARADLYAMGVVLYRLATSKLPFKGETPFAMAQSQVNDPPTPIRLMRDGLPVWIEQVIGRALSKSPADRFQTADEFRETLKRGLAGLPIESAPNAFMPPELSMTVALAVPSGDTGATPVGTSGQVPVAPAHTGPTAMPSGATPMASGGTPMPSGATAMPSGATPMASGATPMSTGAIAASSTSETRMMSGAIPMGTGATPMSTGATPSAGGTGATARPDLDASSAPTVMMGTGQGAYGAAGAGGTASVEAQTVRAAIPGASGLQEKKSSSGTMIALGAVVIAVIGLAAWWFSRGTSAPPTETPTPTATVAAIDATPTPTTATPDPSLTATPTPSVTATPSSSASPTPTGTLKPTPSVSATTTPTPTVADSHVVYSNVKMIEVTGKKGTERDINLSFVAGQISIVPRKGGEAVLTMPYRQIVKGTYVRAKDPKWDISLPYPMDGLDLPGLFRGAGEWLVLQWNTGYLILKLDGSNVREVLGTVEARTGAKIDRPAPGGK